MSELLKAGQRWVLRLSEAETLTLEEGARHHPHPQARERCAALLKVAAGHSPHWVAKHGFLLERDPDSLYQWLRYYAEGGIVALLSRRHGGAHRRRLRPGRAAARAPVRSAARPVGSVRRAAGGSAAQSLEASVHRSDV